MNSNLSRSISFNPRHSSVLNRSISAPSTGFSHSSSVSLLVSDSAFQAPLPRLPNPKSSRPSSAPSFCSPLPPALDISWFQSRAFYVISDGPSRSRAGELHELIGKLKGQIVLTQIPQALSSVEPNRTLVGITTHTVKGDQDSKLINSSYLVHWADSVEFHARRLLFPSSSSLSHSTRLYPRIILESTESRHAREIYEYRYPLKIPMLNFTATNEEGNGAFDYVRVKARENAKYKGNEQIQGNKKKIGKGEKSREKDGLIEDSKVDRADLSRVHYCFVCEKDFQGDDQEHALMKEHQNLVKLPETFKKINALSQIGQKTLEIPQAVRGEIDPVKIAEETQKKEAKKETNSLDYWWESRYTIEEDRKAILPAAVPSLNPSLNLQQQAACKRFYEKSIKDGERMIRFFHKKLSDRYHLSSSVTQEWFKVKENQKEKNAKKNSEFEQWKEYFQLLEEVKEEEKKQEKEQNNERKNENEELMENLIHQNQESANRKQINDETMEGEKNEPKSLVNPGNVVEPIPMLVIEPVKSESAEISGIESALSLFSTPEEVKSSVSSDLEAIKQEDTKQQTEKIIEETQSLKPMQESKLEESQKKLESPAPAVEIAMKKEITKASSRLLNSIRMHAPATPPLMSNTLICDHDLLQKKELLLETPESKQNRSSNKRKAEIDLKEEEDLGLDALMPEQSITEGIKLKERQKREQMNKMAKVEKELEIVMVETKSQTMNNQRIGKKQKIQEKNINQSKFSTPKRSKRNPGLISSDSCHSLVVDQDELLISTVMLESPATSGSNKRTQNSNLFNTPQQIRSPDSTGLERSHQMARRQVRMSTAAALKSTNQYEANVFMDETLDNSQSSHSNLINFQPVHSIDFSQLSSKKTRSSKEETPEKVTIELLLISAKHPMSVWDIANQASVSEDKALQLLQELQQEMKVKQRTEGWMVQSQEVNLITTPQGRKSIKRPSNKNININHNNHQENVIPQDQLLLLQEKVINIFKTSDENSKINFISLHGSIGGSQTKLEKSIKNLQLQNVLSNVDGCYSLNKKNKWKKKLIQTESSDAAPVDAHASSAVDSSPCSADSNHSNESSVGKENVNPSCSSMKIVKKFVLEILANHPTYARQSISKKLPAEHRPYLNEALKSLVEKKQVHFTVNEAKTQLYSIVQQKRKQNK
jgi:hypothetical protein